MIEVYPFEGKFMLVVKTVKQSQPVFTGSRQQSQPSSRNTPAYFWNQDQWAFNKAGGMKFDTEQQALDYLDQNEARMLDVVP